MPIKIDEEKASYNQIGYNSPTSNRSIYFGFLCIDSLKTFTTKTELKAFETAVEYAKGFADSLFVYFEKVLVTRQNS